MVAALGLGLLWWLAVLLVAYFAGFWFALGAGLGMIVAGALVIVTIAHRG